MSASTPGDPGDPVVDLLQADPNRIPFMADPVPLLQRLQDDAPIHWSSQGGAWMVTRYKDVRAGFNDRRLGVARNMPPAEIFEEEFRETYRAYASSLKTWVVISEPPDHTRLRKLANRGLTPTAIEGLRPEIATLVDELLAQMPGGGRGPQRVMWTLCSPLPIRCRLLSSPC
ncbi:MAG: hypothetical protein OSB58_07530 [Alphaproteobacteria bacterium]|nr:hypothetical protein [Alphaproteobacteria bacterium]